MNTEKQKGERISFTNGGAAIAVNTPVVVGTLLGIAVTDIAAGQTGALAITGVHKLPKVASGAIGQGEHVKWDVSAGAVEDDGFTAASGDLENFGIAHSAAVDGATTIEVLLLPGRATVA